MDVSLTSSQNSVDCPLTVKDKVFVSGTPPPVHESNVPIDNEAKMTETATTVTYPQSLAEYISVITSKKKPATKTRQRARRDHTKELRKCMDQMTPVEREAYRERNRKRYHARVANQTLDEAALRRALQREKYRNRVQKETPEQKASRVSRLSAKRAEQRAAKKMELAPTVTHPQDSIEQSPALTSSQNPVDCSLTLEDWVLASQSPLPEPFTNVPTSYEEQMILMDTIKKILPAPTVTHPQDEYVSVMKSSKKSTGWKTGRDKLDSRTWKEYVHWMEQFYNDEYQNVILFTPSIDYVAKKLLIWPTIRLHL